MAVREGNLEAPTRHPIAWKNPEYYDEQKRFRSWSASSTSATAAAAAWPVRSFPTLFDLVDEGKTGEVDGVDKKDYWKVVDQCYLCDLCYMTKCPYVPPHEWNVDYPHTMLRAKAIKFKRWRRLRLEVPAVHRRARPVRRHPDRDAGGQRGEPDQARRARWRRRCTWTATPGCRRWPRASFRSAAPKAPELPVKDGERTPGKVAVFATCYVNYNEPGIGLDLLKVLRHNEIPYVVVSKEQCCGMPKLELGDLESVDKGKRANIPVLAKYAREGWAILSPVPSCTLMFKQEIPLMYPDDAEVQAVKEAMWDPFEYLAARRRDGLLKTEFPQPLGKVSYHVPTTARAEHRPQDRGAAEDGAGTAGAHQRALLGHAGTYGVKKPRTGRDEDRQAAVQAHGRSTRRAARPTTSAPTARWPATTSTRASTATALGDRSWSIP